MRHGTNRQRSAGWSEASRDARGLETSGDIGTDLHARVRGRPRGEKLPRRRMRAVRVTDGFIGPTKSPWEGEICGLVGPVAAWASV